jgi:hypothetical protein
MKGYKYEGHIESLTEKREKFWELRTTSGSDYQKSIYKVLKQSTMVDLGISLI